MRREGEQGRIKKLGTDNCNMNRVPLPRPRPNRKALPWIKFINCLQEKLIFGVDEKRKGISSELKMEYFIFYVNCFQLLYNAIVQPFNFHSLFRLLYITNFPGKFPVFLSNFSNRILIRVTAQFDKGNSITLCEKSISLLPRLEELF